MNAMNGQTSERIDPNPILKECREVGLAINEVERKVEELRTMYHTSTSIAAAEELHRHTAEIDEKQDYIISLCRNLGQRVNRLKSNPESGNPINRNQVGKTERALKKAKEGYLSAGSEYRAILREQKTRQYLTIKPDATEAELKQVADDLSDQSLFSQAVSNP